MHAGILTNTISMDTGMFCNYNNENEMLTKYIPIYLFRFDGITSMIYTHHGVAHAFTSGYDEYYHPDVRSLTPLVQHVLTNLFL